ncbi:MAG: hypothetical protein K2Q26_09080 [Bdellovibrionales bacterium]|nr:hypothetical protein [Bdellovibrionales bacterium]
MENLKVSSVCAMILGISFAGCTTSSFKLLNQKDMAMEFLITPDRIILECERVETDDRGVVAGFLMYVVDDKKTSFTMVQTNTLDRESCERRIKKIERILSNGRQIYLAGIGDFREPRELGPRKYTFPRLGTIEHNGRSLQFIAVKNELNQCFGAFSAEEPPCPPEPFPIKK